MTQDTKSPRAVDARESIVFSAAYAPPDQAIAAGLLEQASAGTDAERRIDAYATRLIEGIRGNAGGLGGIEDFLHAYSLSTKEGLALMVLAEALLRVPDAATADRLIEDKLATGDWSSHSVKSNALLVVGLGLDAGHHRPHHPARARRRTRILESLAQAARPAGGARGDAPGDAAPRLAFRARTDHRGGARARRRASARLRYSFDMLGEGARTAADAERYFAAYAACHRRDRRERRQGALSRAGRASRSSSRRCIRASRRLSRDRVLDELVPQGCSSSPAWRASIDLNFTVDAEEADRLELSLDVIAAVLPDPSLRGWDGFGLAVQAYQKRAPAVIDWLDETARGARPPPDGAAGQGRLLGHRDQARAGARARRLSGVHPQGDDRPLLHGLRAQAARGARRGSIRNSPPTTRSRWRA